MNKSGCNRKQILAKTGLSSGGDFNFHLESLGQSGFIEEHLPLETTARKNVLYRLSDMFTLFHLKWLEGKRPDACWEKLIAGQLYKSWCGHAFEVLAWNHGREIAHALALSKSTYHITRASLKNIAGSAQIDLLIEVEGGAIYLIELKFCEGVYTMTTEESAKLLQRRKVVAEHYRNARSIIVCLLTQCDVQHNAPLDAAVDAVLDSGSLWKSMPAI